MGQSRLERIEEENSFGRIVQTLPHLALSALLTLIAVPYIIIGSADRILEYGPMGGCTADPVARYDLIEGFLDESKFLNFWAAGFDDFYYELTKK